ncbi:MAG: thioredoxin family protein [Candidatus Woesearchaeota archaeon]
MKIEIFGSGCPKCKKLEENAKKAVEELKLNDVKIEHVYDVNKIVDKGILFTPAIAVNGEIKAQGKIPDVKEIKEWLK